MRSRTDRPVKNRRRAGARRQAPGEADRADEDRPPRTRRVSAASPGRSSEFERAVRSRLRLFAALSAVAPGAAVVALGTLGVLTTSRGSLGEPISRIAPGTIGSAASTLHDWSVAVVAFVVLATCWLGALATVHAVVRVVARRR